MSCRSEAMKSVMAAAIAGVKAAGGAGAAPLEKAFEALRSYGWGSDRAALGPIDAAVKSAHGDEAARKELEERLAAALMTESPVAATYFICRTLSRIGTGGSVPALSPLLLRPDLSDMARYALERIPAAEAVAALRDALPKVEGRAKVGTINSLGVRRDAPSVPALTALLADPDREVAAAAAAALGAVGNPAAAAALSGFLKEAPAALRPAAADACLVCAEVLAAGGKKAEAEALYRALSDAAQAPHVRRAALRGLEGQDG